MAKPKTGAKRREFFVQDDTSNKFWTIELSGSSSVTTTHGRIGAKPRKTVTRLPSLAAAQKDLERQIAAKLRKGYREGKCSALVARPKTDWAALTMSEDVFWRLIGILNWKKRGDDDDVVEPVVAALAQMSEAAIRRFEDLLTKQLYSLDTEAIAREIGDGAYAPPRYFSVDEFLYARCAAICGGRAHVATVLAEPNKIGKDREFEALLYVASSAFERKTNRAFTYSSRLSAETFSNKAGWTTAKSARKETAPKKKALTKARAKTAK